MVALRFLASVLASAALFLQTSAHSIKRDPLQSITLVDNPKIHSFSSDRVHSRSDFRLTFTLHDRQQDVRLELEPNYDILSDTFTVTKVDSKGKQKSKTLINRADHNVFKGRTFVRRGQDWRDAGSARITVQKDGKDPLFHGVFRIDGNSHNVQIGKAYEKSRNKLDPPFNTVGDKPAESMVVWRSSDLSTFSADHTDLKRDLTNATSCASDVTTFNSRFDDNYRAIDTNSLLGRQTIDDDGGSEDAPGLNLLDSIGSTDGCPGTSQVALLGVATDCNYWEEFDQNEEDIRSNIISVVNAASEVFESTFQISLGLQELVVNDEDCPSSASSTAPWNVDCDSGLSINDRLSLFSEWRGRTEDTNAFWSLFTTCGTGSAVGLAWRGELCVQGSTETETEDANGQPVTQAVSSANVVVRGPTEWQIFAHETGHTFGAVHDCFDNSCPMTDSTEMCCPLSRRECDADQNFLMNPATGDSMTTFSPCSIGNICSALASGLVDDSCLTANRNIDTIVESQCGNGIVETGEDCDCGGDEACQQSSCCDAATCQFRNGAVCDPSNEDCCTGECQFASQGFVCRESAGQCDPEETCPGDSSQCPEDDHTNDGDSCGDGDLRCASGQCTSRTQQCQSTVGNFGTSDQAANCNGYDRCRVTCSAPEFGDQCVTYPQNFIDGTPCRDGLGFCRDGDCDGVSLWEQIEAWITDNLEIVIPVAVVIGILLILAIGSCILSCVRRKRRTRAPKTISPPPPVAQSNWQQSQHYGANNGWRSPIPHSGVPMNAPPVYDYSPVQPEQERWLQRQPTERYA